jgi:hypothetical protein
LPEQWSQHVPVQGVRRRESRGIFRIVPGVDRHESEIFGRSNKRIVLSPLLSFRIDAAMAVVIAPRQRSSGLLGYNAWNGQIRSKVETNSSPSHVPASLAPQRSSDLPRHVQWRSRRYAGSKAGI